MKTCLFCFSDSGARLAESLCNALGFEKKCVHTIEKFAEKYGFTSHKCISDDMENLFKDSDALIFICACGIAVREISPYLESKTDDPAVVVIDDCGKYVIPILSGHIGGANALSKRIAELIGALPVITSATDAAEKFSCDDWAAKNDYAISSIKTAKEISSAILRNDIPVCSDYNLPACLPNGLIMGAKGDIGIYIGIYEKSPYKTTLRLIPRTLTVGVGCRRGAGKEQILSVIKNAFKEKGLDIRAVHRIASIDIKKDEEGLIAAAEELNAELLFFTKNELESVSGDFKESEFVKNAVGIGNVCERAAVLGGGRLILYKTAENGVTAAVAEEERRIEF